MMSMPGSSQPTERVVVIGPNPEMLNAFSNALKLGLIESGLFVEMPDSFEQSCPPNPTRFERLTHWLWNASYKMTLYPSLMLWAVLGGLVSGWDEARGRWLP